nr:hypothetical protein CFP56_25387 [Quercus suber]
MILDELKLIDLNGCTSLEILPLRPDVGLYPFPCLLNCVKLINNEDYSDMLLTKLRHHIQFKGHQLVDYIIIPGSEIPKWFRHQSVGTSVNLQVPSSDKLKGVAVCALFVLRQHHPPHSAHVTSGEQFGKIESYHLHLGYFPYESFNPKLKENWSQVDANGLGQIEIGVKTEGPGLEVTKFGFRWVYEQDIEDLNQTMCGCSSNSTCSITPYEDDLEDSAKDTKTE